MEVIKTARYLMELTDGDRKIYPTFQDAAYEWLRLWGKTGCGTLCKAIGKAEGIDRDKFSWNARAEIALLSGGCHEEAMAIIRDLNDQIKDVPEQIEATRSRWPKGCPNCGSPEITIQETRAFSVLLDFSEAHDDRIEEETNPGCNTTTYNCTKCGHQEIEG